MTNRTFSIRQSNHRHIGKRTYLSVVIPKRHTQGIIKPKTRKYTNNKNKSCIEIALHS